ncbi:PAS domain S-box protein [Ensifer sp. Root423]|uniref:PAS domain S-box protein n=1 Tax=Ensifer sp. Root423 TaxID=1736534 RepID=UPI0009EBA842
MSRDPPTSQPNQLNRSGEADDFEDLFEHAPCGYLSLEPNGRILRANATVATWTGYSSVELKGRSFHDLLNVAGRLLRNSFCSVASHAGPLQRGGPRICQTVKRALAGARQRR